MNRQLAAARSGAAPRVTGYLLAKLAEIPRRGGEPVINFVRRQEDVAPGSPDTEGSRHIRQLESALRARRTRHQYVARVPSFDGPPGFAHRQLFNDGARPVVTSSTADVAGISASARSTADVALPSSAPVRSKVGAREYSPSAPTADVAPRAQFDLNVTVERDIEDFLDLDQPAASNDCLSFCDPANPQGGAVLAWELTGDHDFDNLGVPWSAFASPIGTPPPPSAQADCGDNILSAPGASPSYTCFYTRHCPHRAVLS